MRVFLSIIWMLLTVSWSFQNPKHDITKGVWHVIDIKGPAGSDNKTHFFSNGKIRFSDKTNCILYRDSLIYSGTYHFSMYSKKHGDLTSFCFEGKNGSTLETYQMEIPIKFVGDSLMFFIEYNDKGKQNGYLKFVRRSE